MKRAVLVALLLLLLQNELHKTESADSPKALYLPSELRQLRALVYEQGTALVEMKLEMKHIEQDNAALKTKLEKLIKLSKQSESNLVESKKEASAQVAQLSTTKAKLEVREKQVKKVKKETAAMQVSLQSNQKDLQNLQKENTALKGRLATSEGTIEDLKSHSTERSKIAFTAALPASLGPITGDSNVVYSNIITNIGGGYNSGTGLFTAPVKGVYYIRLTSCTGKSGYYVGVYLYKNHERLLYQYQYDYNGYIRFISGGITVQMNAGDYVYTRLPSGYALLENGKNCNTFTGFCLFAMS